MPVLHLSQVSFSHSTAVPLLQQIELRLDPGWYGLVGANGAGKTTLLRLLAGQLEPDLGEIRTRPPSLTRAYCAQEVEARTGELESFGCACDGRARRLQGRLRLEPGQLERWETLSPGERKRWQIGAALASEPGLLLLDEPTNHLDAEARSLLLDALAEHRGIGVVVSHDRVLLNTLPEHTMRLHGGSVEIHRGGYDAARDTWEREERERRDERDRLSRERRKLERRLRDRQDKKRQSMADLRTSKHMHGKSPKDKAARRPFKFTRRRSRDVSLGKEVRKTHHRIERVETELRGFDLEKSLGRSLFVDFVPAPSPTLLTLRAPELRVGGSRDDGCDGRVLLRDVDVAIERDSRVRVAGPNGAGKTTLLRALLASARGPQERLLYLPQELGEARTLALLERTRALDADLRGQVLALVAALGVAPEPLLASRHPSPGEARKLALALGLATQVQALVLDEPTNHLDLPAIERLEQMLEHYPGALVVVTHDEAFARRCTRRRWDLVDGRVRVGL